MTDAFHDLDPQTTGATLVNAARLWPQRDAFVIGERRLTWRGLYEGALRYARALVGLGVGPGDHIGVLAPNCVEYLLLFHAAGLVGARALTINARYREDDLLHVIAAADVDWLFIGGHALPHADYRGMIAALYPELADWRFGAPLAAAAAPRLRGVFNFADPRETQWPDETAFLALGDAVGVEAVAARAKAVRGGDIALMMFSSGTTSRPKACMLTHANLSLTGAALAKRFRMGADDRIFDPMPFFHMSTMLPLAACRASGCAFLGQRHFDPAAALATMERERATIAYVSFPTIVSAIVGRPDFPGRDLSALRIVHCVGPADLLRRYAALFPQAYFVSAYGLTEASGVPFYSDVDDPQDLSLETAGRPFDGVEVRIVDPETRAVLPVGGRGEIELRGYCVFAGYYGDDEKTRAVMSADGWLSTGDVGEITPQGPLRYTGRIKDMLKIGGENVAAVEIESFLCTHPAVQIAQVIGVPDERLFEVAAAFVELRPGAEASAEELVRHCIGRIASFKVPRYVRFVREWPLSTTKIQKFRLPRDFDPAQKFDVRAMAAGG